MTVSKSSNLPVIVEGGRSAAGTALRLAASGLCEKGGSDPCLSCLACRKVMDGQHPDVITLDLGEDKEIPVDEVRALRSDAFIKPFEAAQKVYIISHAQNLNKHGQNALLTILEEPPPYCRFILTASSSGSLLPTVLSRCAVLRSGADEASCPEEVKAWCDGVISALLSDDELALAASCFEKCAREQLSVRLEALSAALCSAAGVGRLSSGALVGMTGAARDILNNLEYNAGVDASCGLLCVKLWEAYHIDDDRRSPL